jgi:hypothetical protein
MVAIGLQRAITALRSAEESRISKEIRLFV